MSNKYLLILAVLFFVPFIQAKDLDTQCKSGANTPNCTTHSNGHTDAEHSSNEEHDEDHDEDHRKDPEDAHKDEEHETSSQIGPEKGILEADEKRGFKLSPEAIKNFDLKFQVVSASTLNLPISAILQTGEENNIYRLRNGFIKRIDFQTLAKTKTQYQVQSKDLMDGDQVIINGLGFVRMAELAASGGAPESHSH